MVRDRLMLFRPLTGALIHPGVEWVTGKDIRRRSTYGELTLTVPPEYHNKKAGDGAKLFLKRGTIAAIVRPSGAVRQAGLVQNPQLTADGMTVMCGGLSMLVSQSGPWEGHQGYYLHMDPITLFRRIIAQVQAYDNANLGIRVTGDTSTGSNVGDEGSVRYQEARRSYNRYKPELDKWEGRNLTRERIMGQRTEALFRAVGLKRVGNVNVTDNEPESPGYQANSTIWIRGETGRAYVWRGDRWVSQSQADEAVARYLSYQGTVQRGKEELQRLQYLAEPAKELMDEYEQYEGREEYSLYYWQNHNMGEVIDDLTELGPFEYREQTFLIEGDDGKPRLDHTINVGTPCVGVRRENLRLELGVNVQDHPPVEHGDLYTGVALFGAGQGSEVLSEQRSWDPKHAVRNIRVETDKDAHTKALTRNAANDLLQQIQADAGMRFANLVIHHTKAAPEGSFDVGDELYLAGKLSDGTKVDRWIRVTEATHEWGSNTTSIEVEPV